MTKHDEATAVESAIAWCKWGCHEDQAAAIADAEKRGERRVRERVEATGYADRLRELGSFVMVETAHWPTLGEVNNLRRDIRAALAEGDADA